MIQFKVAGKKESTKILSPFPFLSIPSETFSFHLLNIFTENKNSRFQRIKILRISLHLLLTPFKTSAPNCANFPYTHKLMDFQGGRKCETRSTEEERRGGGGPSRNYFIADRIVKLIHEPPRHVCYRFLPLFRRTTRPSY